ncbi:MAG: ribonuclease activity regulator RraA [Bacteroidetes bacterium]|nr:ribonuclease activity regulator RraA [Bacteroidota bacterium]MCL5025715.1 ribonuclease activity regulator RraA [Chloroflexota bacterium]
MASFRRIPKEQLEALKEVSTATVAGLLPRMGIRSCFMTGLFPLRPDLKMAGQARTVRYTPAREDLNAGAPEDRYLRPQWQVIEAIEPGDVLVMDGRGELGGGVIGDILATRVKYRGGAGIVVDGGVRDTVTVKTLDIPTYLRGMQGAPGPVTLTDVDWDVPVGCAGTTVVPGDVILGDGDGVVVIPLALFDQVLKEGVHHERLEVYIRSKIEAGSSTKGVYPPTKAITEEFDRQAH